MTLIIEKTLDDCQRKAMKLFPGVDRNMFGLSEKAANRSDSFLIFTRFDPSTSFVVLLRPLSAVSYFNRCRIGIRLKSCLSLSVNFRSFVDQMHVFAKLKASHCRIVL